MQALKRKGRKLLRNPPMTPVYQTKFGADDGNCLPACIATITGYRLGELPELDREDRQWFTTFHDKLLALGIQIQSASHWRHRDVPYIKCVYFQPPGVEELFCHAVVVLDGVVVHDPNPLPKCNVGYRKNERGAYYIGVTLTGDD